MTPICGCTATFGRRWSCLRVFTAVAPLSAPTPSPDTIGVALVDHRVVHGQDVDRAAADVGEGFHGLLDAGHIAERDLLGNRGVGQVGGVAGDDGQAGLQLDLDLLVAGALYNARSDHGTASILRQAVEPAPAYDHSRTAA